MVAVASDRGHNAFGVYFSNHIIGTISDIQVALLIGSKRAGVTERRFTSRTTVAIMGRLPGASDRRDFA